jgi:hypothetical protein
MHHMAEPKQIDLMTHAVCPIVEKVHPDKSDDNPIPCILQSENAKILVDEGVSCHGKNLGEDTRQLFYDSAAYICNRVIEAINLSIFKISIGYFHSDKDEENGDRKNYGVDVHDKQKYKTFAQSIKIKEIAP